MSDNEDTFYRVSADFENIEDAKRFKRQIENMQNDDESDSRLSLLARIRDANSPQDVARVLRGSGISLIDMISACVYSQRCTEVRVTDLERQIADLRSSQQPADPTGAHPYRSPVISATAKPRDRVYVSADHPDYPYAAAPSSPVVTSDALGRPETRPGALRRVYGPLASQWPALAVAAGFSYASGVAFALSPAASGALAGIAFAALVRAGVWGFVR